MGHGHGPLVGPRDGPLSSVSPGAVSRPGLHHAYRLQMIVDVTLHVHILPRFYCYSSIAIELEGWVCMCFGWEGLGRG